MISVFRISIGCKESLKREIDKILKELKLSWMDLEPCYFRKNEEKFGDYYKELQKLLSHYECESIKEEFGVKEEVLHIEPYDGWFFKRSRERGLINDERDELETIKSELIQTQENLNRFKSW